ncbi:protein white isoform X2 [Hyalella azteca]|uniref:Protein white n=1 Tax=Hyalella azteca TaxID=294128 RepID=A0A8B7NPI9_HYAAZ|nr:protein white isoform X2 [Hyalella azteca]
MMGHDSIIDVERGLQRSQSKVTQQITYSWHNVNVFARPPTGCCGKKSKNAPTKHILKNVSGICRPGELLAIMGASGAGKTTLLNVLTGRGGDLLNVSGNLCVNGLTMKPSQLTSQSAYVQQDDLFVGTLTVKEQLIFQARLRMDRNIPHEKRMERVREVMQELSLTKCQNTLIGIPGRIKGISGGETKRLAFACEVLTNPSLMLCDEPTTGLDSFMAQTIVEAMRDMAQTGRTIISTIHQPSSEVFALFDRVLLMAEGRVAFLGLTTEALAFFERAGKTCPDNFNPADFFIMTLAVEPDREEESKSFIAKVCDDYDANEGKEVTRQVLANSAGGKKEDVFSDSKTHKSPYKASWTSQFSAVLVRSTLEILRDPTQLRIKIIQTIMIALLLGLIFLDQENDQAGAKNCISVLFLLLTNMTFQNTFGVVNLFATEVEIFTREHENGMYRSDVFFIAKNVAEIPMAVLQPVLFVGVIYYMVGLNPGADNFFICMGIIVLVANIGVSFGYLISCLARNLEMALAIAAPLIIPFMLFGGFFLNSDSVPVYFIWLQYISWFNYANEALNINQWDDFGSIGCEFGNNTSSLCPYQTGDDVLRDLNFESDNFGMDIGVMFALLFGFRIIAFAFLFGRLYRKKSD